MFLRNLFICLVLSFSSLTLNLHATELQVNGQAKVSMTGYSLPTVREKQDAYMQKKSEKSGFEVIQNKQVDEALRQASVRKNQDVKWNQALRQSVVQSAQEKALINAIETLIDRTLGVGVNQKPEVQAQLATLVTQASTYVLNKTYTAEVNQTDYIAYVNLTVDETKFRSLLSDMGLATHTVTQRQNKILVYFDEYFTTASDFKSSDPSLEVTTYKHNAQDKFKHSVKASTYDNTIKKDRSNSAGFSGVVSPYVVAVDASKSSSNSLDAGMSRSSYGNFVDYSSQDATFFQQVKLYAPKQPALSNLNYTQPALQQAFTDADLAIQDNDAFKSRFFKAKPLSVNDLSQSPQLAEYLNFAKNVAKADFIAIGISYIVDNGLVSSTGLRHCDANAYVKIYSTTDGQLITSGTLSETAAGNSLDQARTQVAQKLGRHLGNELAVKVQNYWKKRSFYGSEYTVSLKGAFTPAERMRFLSAIKKVASVQGASIKQASETGVEVLVTYNGQDALGDLIFLSVLEDPILEPLFREYDYRINQNTLELYPKTKGSR